MTKRPINETIPAAPLKIIAMDNCSELGDKVDKLIVDARHALVSSNKNTLPFLGYEADTYLVRHACERFGSGEGKGSVYESIRGKDLFIITDIVNNHISYSISGNHIKMTPDDHFQDLKRIIAACSGHSHRIHVIMPFLYEGRQNKRKHLESLDCSMALQELVSMGVDTFITFDAHEPRVQNAIPIQGFDNFHTSYQFIRTLMENDCDVEISKDNLMIISPDEGGMKRAVFYANMLGIEMGMFYKRRNYSTVVNGTNPVVAIEFLGNNLEGKDAFLVDDMISTGETVIEVAKELKKRKAKKVIIAATFGLFTEGIDKFDIAYEKGYFDKIYTTNLTHCPEELMKKPYYVSVDLSKYIALIIDTLNNDTSVNEIQDASKIKELLENQK